MPGAFWKGSILQLMHLKNFLKIFHGVLELFYYMFEIQKSRQIKKIKLFWINSSPKNINFLQIWRNAHADYNAYDQIFKLRLSSAKSGSYMMWA